MRSLDCPVCAERAMSLWRKARCDDRIGRCEACSARLAYRYPEWLQWTARLLEMVAMVPLLYLLFIYPPAAIAGFVLVFAASFFLEAICVSWKHEPVPRDYAWGYRLGRWIRGLRSRNP